ncbi:MAG: InlB B-repeat-containing protein [Acutalibacteraceae bacterium]
MKKGMIAGILSLMLAITACLPAFAAETVGKNGQIYQPGDTVLIDENADDAKFEAVWGVKVVFKDYDGTVLSEQVVEVGKNAKRPQSPTRDGYTFVGWSGDYTNIQAETTITAVYQKKASSGTNSSDTSQNETSGGNQQGTTGTLPVGGAQGNGVDAMNTPRPSTSSESSASSQEESQPTQSSQPDEDEDIGDDSTPLAPGESSLSEGEQENSANSNSWLVIVCVVAGVIVVGGGAAIAIVAAKKKKQAK